MSKLNPLKILPINPEKTNRKKIKKLHPNLPSPYGLFIMIIAPIKCGKSVTISNLCLNDNFYNDIFRDIHICSNTISHDSSSRFLYDKYKNTCYDTYDDGIIKTFLKTQKNRMDNGDSDTSFAWVFDDILGSISKGRKGGEANFFATRFRHFANRGDPTMMIFSTQKYLSINSIIRNQANVILISGRIGSAREIQAIEQDYADIVGGAANFRKMLSEVRKHPYSWLVIRLDKGSGVEAWLNFDKKLYPSNDAPSGGSIKSEMKNIIEERKIDNEENMNLM
tara:strand:- start:781 stop:1620 length:840 start_codon:yes stop_codon:yes gene_type:complete